MLHSAAITTLIGTYTRDGQSRGVYTFRLDAAHGTCSAPQLAVPASNPNFLVAHPQGKTVLAVGDFQPAPAQPTGAIQAYRFDSAAAVLQPLGQLATGPVGAPCHVAVAPDGSGGVVVNYSGGYVASFALNADGVPTAVSAPIPHTGLVGPHRKRQDKPHPHSTTFSPDSRFALVCDLGLDRITVYPWQAATGTLDVARAAHFATPPGSGPRHSKFSADGRFFYVLNELDATICAFAWQPATGTLSLLQTLATMPSDYAGPTNTGAEIRLHPQGRFLYATNRGHDSIAVVAVDPTSGRLALVERTPSGGQHPRNFNLTPDGQWLLCANRDSNNVVVFRVDATSGRLQANGQVATVSQPVCVLFLP